MLLGLLQDGPFLFTHEERHYLWEFHRCIGVEKLPVGVSWMVLFLLMLIYMNEYMDMFLSETGFLAPSSQPPFLSSSLCCSLVFNCEQYQSCVDQLF